MAKLERKKVWYVAVPGWAGNREEEDPFAVEVARRSDADVEAFRAAAADLHGRWLSGDGAPPVEDLVSLFDGMLRGPTQDLEVDGEVIKAGDLRGLLEQARVEFPIRGCLFLDLVQAVQSINRLEEEAAKNWSRRRGGSGSTETQTTPAAATPPPPAVPTAAA